MTHPRATLQDEILRFIRQHQAVLIAVLFVAVINYGVELFDFTLSIDDELALYDSPPGQYLIARGRWGLYALSHLLLPEVVIPIVPLFLSLACLSVAAVLFSVAWGMETGMARFAVSTLLVSFPALTTILVFKSVAVGIGPGFLLCALAILVVDKRKPGWAGFSLAVALIAFAVSLYQAMLVVALGALLMKHALQFLRRGVGVSLREDAITFLASALAIIVGYGAHGLITRGLTLALGLRDDSYVASILGVSAIAETLGVRFAQGSALSMHILAGSANAFGASIPLWPVLWILALALLVVSVVARRRQFDLLALIFVGAAFVVNVAAALVVGASLRMMLGFAVLAGGAGAILLQLSGRRLVVKAASFLVISLTALQFAQLNNRLLGSVQLAYQNDRMLAQQIAQQIVQAERQAGVKASYIEVSGHWQPPATRAIARVETIGASFFEWGGGDLNRIRMFLSTSGAPLLKVAPPARRIEAIHASLAMPTWPMDGSVTLVGDVVVVKFGPLSPPQLSAIGRICNRLPEEARLDERAKAVCALAR